ncbi:MULTISPECIES: hypothetical protein [unclassified Arenibacter]|uniref:hypothetical protein n=1 Tax=unclassified Arenibacter TaxID=2615047 RepID=UPI000E340E8C|nr:MULTISPECIES: hypothetical protein [unclassified Arenibacter]MCM4162766.1 hypothetical protein [Arenibacter sp. A80]RFT56819.1 hypothetical protein D0S24_04095 [Arenibacter sp. P308M17]
MKNTFLILFLLYFLTGCKEQKLSHKETVSRYYNAFDSGDYNEIKATINDSVTMISGDYVIPYNHDSFYDFFKWDSIFKPSYKIVELDEKNNDIIVTIAQDNVRNEFLKNNPLVFKVKVSFTLEKISKLEELEYIDVNWEVWNQEKDSLVSWIKNNHHDLDGLVEDMTKKGSKDYLKAIELYASNKYNLQ